MKRSACLSLLTVLGLVLVAGTYDAQQPEQHPPIEVQRITDNLHVLASGTTTGGNTAVFITATGVVLVDTKLEGYGPDILEHVRRLTNKPVTTIINTHVHFDHSGANTEFPDTVHFVAHENIRRHWARTDCNPIPTNCDDFQGENAKYLPSTTFSGAHVALRRHGPDRPLLLRTRPYRRGHLRRVPGSARDAHRRHVPRQVAALHRRAERQRRQRPRVRPHADESDQRDPERRHDHHRPLGKRPWRGATWSTIGASTPTWWSTRSAASPTGAAREETAADYATPERYSEYTAAPGSVAAIVNYVYEGR